MLGSVRMIKIGKTHNIVALWMALMVATCISQQTNIYLVPSGQVSSQCPSTECYTIDNFTANYSFQPNTRLILPPGTHTIDRNDSMIHVKNTENLTLIGGYATTNYTTANEPQSIIDCTSTGRFALVFHNVVNLKLYHVVINHCSLNSTRIPYNIIQLVLDTTILVSYSTKVTIEHVRVSNGSGIGILLYQVNGHVAISHSVFTNSTVNCHLSTEYPGTIFVTISFSEFSFGDIKVENGFLEPYFESSGIGINLEIDVVHLHFTNVSLICNSGTYGNLYLHLHTTVSEPFHSTVNIEGLNSTHTCNQRKLKDWQLLPNDGLRMAIAGGGKTNITMANSFFTSASVYITTKLYDGLKLTYVNMMGVIIKDIQELLYAITFYHVQFVVLENITITNVQALLIQSRYSGITLKGYNTIQGNKGGIQIDKSSTLTFDINSSNRFMNNICLDHKNDFTCSICDISGISSKLTVRDGSYILFRNNTASSSITLHASTMSIYGGTNVSFEGNKGEKGGAMSFYAGSRLLFCQVIPPFCRHFLMNITFTQNHATQIGGAIFVEDTSYINAQYNSLSKTFLDDEDCIIHVPIFLPCTDNETSGTTFKNVHVSANFVSNSADIAGSALYGGWYDLVTLIGHQYEIFHFYGQPNDHSIVSSNPVRVCMCVSTTPNCNTTEYTAEVYKGQTFEIQAVTVGQRFGTVPAIVHVEFNHIDSKSNSTITEGQYVQSVTKYCTTLRYTVLSVNHKESLLLTTERIAVPTNSLRRLKDEKWAQVLLSDLTVYIVFKNCPAGFAINGESNRCICHQFLVQNGIDTCDIETGSIRKPIQMWINATFVHIDGNTTPGVIVHKHCPYDYCQVLTNNSATVAIDLRAPNEQCAHNRSGVLCGACKSNFSHVLGSSRCKMCSSLWVLLLLPTIALAGVALVVFLICFNMTVSIGAINGLLFYANIVRANHNVFFTGNTVLSVFISWLNLDLGIEVCLYHNLDAYTKTWLQFVFPLYIWFIVISIIVSSHYSTTAARLCGTNVVSVLATLFLMSYAKLLRVFITVFQPTVLVYPDGYHRQVWHYDGNVDYLKGKHIPLFIAALLLLLILTIPYTTSLIFIQCLRKINHLPILFWVRRLKPLFDAHTGPYKDNHCYWTGLLLLVRVALFTVFSVNVSGDASINLLAIGLTILCLLTYLSLVGGVYRSWLINSFEVFSYLNIGVLTLATYFYRSTPTPKTTDTSVGIALCSFMFITGYHICLRITSTHRGEQLVKALKSKLKNSYPSQVIGTLIAPVPKTPVSHSSIELQEPLLDEVTQ